MKFLGDQEPWPDITKTLKMIIRARYAPLDMWELMLGNIYP
jgi:hypothetical protein